jgi:hypothetical protein
MVRIPSAAAQTGVAGAKRFHSWISKNLQAVTRVQAMIREYPQHHLSAQ